jgi:hypothetical protein
MLVPHHQRRIALGILFASLLLSGCDSTMKTRMHETAPAEAANAIERNLEYYSKQLRLGMPRREVLAFLPPPQNTNNENVCVWVLESTEAVKTQGRYDWQWLQATRGGFFIVFVDDKLATPVCANAAFNPWQALEHYANVSIDEAQRILGKKP